MSVLLGLRTRAEERRSFLCFSFGGRRRGEFVSGNRRALTFKWRRRGARGSGGDVDSML